MSFEAEKYGGQDKQWSTLLDLVRREVTPRADGKMCPKVSALIVGEGLEEGPIEKYHDHENRILACKHAEQQAIDDLLIRIGGGNNPKLSNLGFFTSLEPCNRRGQYNVPCAHRIATMGFAQIHIGMMDPDPNIFGHGVCYLIENLGRDKVFYAPRRWREEFVKENADFILDKEEKFDFSRVTKSFPVFTGIDEELYLRLAHSLFRMFKGEKIEWLFPELPTFSDRHKFQAVWTEGILEESKKKEKKHWDEILIVMHEKEWNKNIEKACKSGMKDTLLKEFENRNKPEVKIIIKAHDENNCPCKYFKGAIIYDKRGEIAFLVIPSYTEILNVPMPMFLVCEPGYIARCELLLSAGHGRQIGEISQDNVEKKIDELKEVSLRAIGGVEPENLYDALKREMDKQA